MEVTGSNPVEALIFSGFVQASNCLNWKIYCDDHSSLSKQTFMLRKTEAANAKGRSGDANATYFLEQVWVLVSV